MSKKEMIDTFSLAELATRGYKQRADRRHWYLGDSKFPTQTINEDQEQLLGKQFEVMGFHNGKYLVENGKGEEFYIKEHLIKKIPPKKKIHKTIFRDEVIIYSGYGFDFPCTMRNMGKKEAIEMANWVLKVTK